MQKENLIEIIDSTVVINLFLWYQAFASRGWIYPLIFCVTLVSKIVSLLRELDLGFLVGCRLSDVFVFVFMWFWLSWWFTVYIISYLYLYLRLRTLLPILSICVFLLLSEISYPSTHLRPNHALFPSSPPLFPCCFPPHFCIFIFPLWLLLRILNLTS